MKKDWGSEAAECGHRVRRGEEEEALVGRVILNPPVGAKLEAAD
jgi:hypothetical protein